MDKILPFPDNLYFAYSSSDKFKLKEAGLCIYNSTNPYYERIVYDYELVFVTEGLLSLQEDDSEINLHKNEGFIFFPKSTRSAGLVDIPYGTTYFWLHFNIEKTDESFSFHKRIIPRFSSTANPSRLTSLLKWYIHDYIEGRENSDYQNDLFHMILAEFSNTQTTSKDNSQNNIVSSAYKYIMENFSHNLSVSDVAKHCQCTPNYLTKVFKEYYGKTTIQFLNNIKIEYAKQLLTTTTLPIKAIAVQSGFSSDLHFRKIFKQLEGCNPKTYQYSLNKIVINIK